MKGHRLVAGASVALICWAVGVQAAENTGRGTPLSAPLAPAAGPADRAADARQPMPPRMPPDGPRPGFDADRMDRLLVIAATQEWAVKDAETQVLAEKILAARKVMLQEELDRVSVFQKVFPAARIGEAEALKSAIEEMRAATDKVRQSGAAIAKEVAALRARLEQIKPVIAPPPEKGPVEPEADAGEAPKTK